MRTTDTYETQGGIQMVRSVEELTLETPLQDVLDGLNRRRGALFGRGACHCAQQSQTRLVSLLEARSCFYVDVVHRTTFRAVERAVEIVSE